MSLRSFAQSRIIFEDAAGYLAPLIERDGKAAWRRQDSANHGRHRAPGQHGARVRCMGSDPRRLHGIRPLLVLADEPAQWEASKSDRARAALATSLGKVPGSRLVALGTRPAGKAHWFARLLATAPYSQVHAADKGDSPFSVRTWRKANPSFDHLPSAWLRSSAKKLARRSSTRTSWRRSSALAA